MEEKRVLPFGKTARDVKKLFLEAFPGDERFPFLLLALNAVRPCIRFAAFYDEGVFCGFIYAVKTRDMVFILYLAASSSVRSKGIGTRIIEEAKRRNTGCPIALDIETPLDESAPNLEQRLRRKAFYTKNGFVDTGLRLDEKEGFYDVLSYGSIDKRKLQDALRCLSLGTYRPEIVCQRGTSNGMSNS